MEAGHPYRRRNAGGTGETGPRSCRDRPKGATVRMVFISDIHANFPALCRSLEWAKRHRADRIVCAGDVVGHGPHPTEVIRLLIEQQVSAIVGNVDRKVLELLESPKKLQKRLKKKSQAPAAWAALSLGDEERAWLAGRPSELRFAAEGVDVQVVHGSPLSDTDYVFPSITAAALLAKLGESRPGLLVCGHSHIPFTRRIAGVRVVNCGSVGRPVDGDPSGALAVCDFPGDGQAVCRIVRFGFPIEPLVADLVSRGARGASPDEYRTGTKAKNES
jgi:putative phosphoesterase